MAESVFFHFRSADWTDIQRTMDRIAYRWPNSDGWRFPDENGAVHAYRYDEVVGEYESDDVQRLIEILGDWPSCTICIELYRSRGLDGVQAARDVITVLAGQYVGSGYDGENLFTAAELKAREGREHFLAWLDEIYRAAQRR
jgi:hypothetical protein